MAGRRLARLLLVDNNPHFIDPVRDHLIDAGWRADVARTPEEALHKVRQNRYQICVLDKRLRDDHDSNDRSGIDLIPTLWRVDGLLHFVVLTGFEEVQEAVEITRTTFLTRERWCEAYIPKDTTEAVLIRELDRVESDAIKLNRDLVAEDAFLEEVLEPLLRETDTSLRAERLRQLSEDARLLLQWIFYDRPQNLHFALLDAQGRSGARILRATAANSAGWILKIATRLAVEEEWNNYTTDVRSAIHQRPDVDEGRCQVGIHLGVIAYSRVAGIEPTAPLHDLRSYLAGKIDGEEGAKTLRSVVSIARAWFMRERTTAVRDLTAYYAAHFHLNADEIARRFHGLHLAIEDEELVRDPVLPAEQIGRAVMNPLPFVARGRFLVESDWNTCHGDLNASNVLMPEGIPWLIDFASTGPGPTCLDWVTLEASLKFDHFWEATPEAWFDFETSLALQEKLEEPLPLPERVGQDLQRLFAAVTTLRAAVGQQAQPRSGMLEYLVGLFYVTLHQVRFFWRKNNKQKGYRILASAGLIAERLMGMGASRNDIGFVYAWRESGLPALELSRIAPAPGPEPVSTAAAAVAQLEALRIEHETLLHKTLNEMLGRKAPIPSSQDLADRFAELDRLKQRIRALRRT